MAVIYLSRRINRWANASLTNDELDKLHKLSNSNGKYNLFIILGIVGLFLLNDRLAFIPTHIASFLYNTLLICYIIFQGARQYNRLNNNDFPKGYIYKVMLANAVRLIGLATLIAII